MTYFNILPNDILLEIGVKLFNNEEIYAYHKLTKIDENIFYHYICNKLTNVFLGLPAECELDGRNFSWMRIAECLATIQRREPKNMDTESILNFCMKKYDGVYTEFYRLMIYKFSLYPNFMLATYIRVLNCDFFNCLDNIKKYIESYVNNALSKCKPLGDYGDIHVDDEGYIIIKCWGRIPLYCNDKLNELLQSCDLTTEDIKKVKAKGYNTHVNI